MTPATTRPAGLALIAAVLLLAIFAAQARNLALHTSSTADEPGHLGAGASYWFNGDYRIVTCNLFLAQRFAGLAPWFTGAHFPTKDRQAELKHVPGPVGEEFLFRSGNDPRRILAEARAMVTVLGIILGAFVFFWARGIFGDGAGVAALALFVLCPPLVANAALVTTDIATTLGFALSFAAYVRLLDRPSPGRAVLAGLALGLLLVTKFSAPGFVAIAALCLLWKLNQKGHASVRALAGAHLALAAVAWLTIWAFFGFHQRPGGYDYPWSELGRDTAIYRAALAAHRWHLLPDPMLYDSNGLRLLFGKRYSFFAGIHRVGGTWTYFPGAFLLKTPPAMIAALALAAALSLRASQGPRQDGNEKTPGGWPLAATIPLWIFALGYLALCMASSLNIGHRHLLPIYPPACVLAGGAVAWLARRGRIGALASTALILWAAGEAAWFQGRQPAYITPMVGGPSRGYRWFVDSTIDWGSALPEVAAWERALFAREPEAPVYLGQLGVDEIGAFGVRATLLSAPGSVGRLHAGYYVLSATALQMGYIFQPGPYSAAVEAEYQASLRTPEHPDVHSGLPSRREQLALARLSAFCRVRAPDARIGDTYFVFHLSAADVEQALRGPLPPGLPEPPIRGL